MEPREGLQTALDSNTDADEYLAGTARLLLRKAEAMFEDAKGFDQTGALTFNAKDVMAVKKEMESLTGTAFAACMRRCLL